MVNILAAKTSLPGCDLPGTSEAVRAEAVGAEAVGAEEVQAEALFASALQPSASPRPDQVRRAVAATLGRLGARGCAAALAGEFGDHPDTAAARMSWALATIRAVSQAPPSTPAATVRALALAS